MRPGVLDHFGLASALNATLDRFKHEHGIAVAFERSGDASARYPADVEVGLLRIVERALENVVQHADAGRVTVRYAATVDGGIDIEVRDDGRGFDPAAIDPDAALGLLDITSRAAALDARVDIDSAPGRGTRVRIVRPGGADDTEAA